MKFKKILPIATNIVYPVVGWFGDWLVFICSIVLALGSAWMHYEEEFKGRRTLPSIYADWVSMYAFFLAILAFHTNLYVIFILATIVVMWEQMRDIKLIGFLVLLTVMVTQSYYAFLVFIPAVIMRLEWEGSKYQEYTHGLWHILTAGGALIIIITG